MVDRGLTPRRELRPTSTGTSADSESHEVTTVPRKGQRYHHTTAALGPLLYANNVLSLSDNVPLARLQAIETRVFL